ncbi:uncharacterized protein N7506_000264 [Penicillium brevicompactum]|uniref:uncharacterized protein n=1 Tax=Penicillium brevicompactum TaxID=5074 RepID=UPI002540EAE8|nr:uncharacterized protein N7506_000264 [Penicillium brevicompactum]KAJ5347011.1 hypothetical protein N7506_000264 [Penicillium brevicompactum]
MDSNPSKSTGPETVFLSTIANSAGNDGVFIVSPPDRRTEMAAPIHSSEPKPMTDPLKPLKPLPFRKRKRASEVPTSTLQPLNEDPWAAYVKGIEILPRKGMLLAQNREDKMELVHIEQLKADPASIRSLVEIIKGLSYRSFPQLLRHYQHDDHTFLVWESVECSLSQVLGSRYALTETEIASIVWPILIGIRYLRNSDRALATLTNDEVLFTGSGGVRIASDASVVTAGVERSCRIDPEDMNAATLKLTALSEMVKSLMRKSEKIHPDFPWTSKARDLPHKLNTVGLDDLMLDDFFASLKGEAELKLMVNIVCKTSHFDINFLTRI